MSGVHSEQELHDMFAGALALPDGQAKLAALDTAIRHAEAGGHDRVAYMFRDRAITPFHFAGDHRRSFLAFSKNLAVFDARPEVAGGGAERSLLWKFKWMVSALLDYPDVPLDRTYAVLEDMRRRYLLGGHSLHPVHQREANIALHVGDLDAAARSYHQMATADHGSLSDCSTCVPSAQTRMLAGMGRFEEAVKVGDPARQGRCAEQPHWIQAYLLEPYVRVGRLADAAEMHRLSYRRMRLKPKYLGGIALHLRFLATTGNEVRGLELLERHLSWLDGPIHSPGARLRFATSAVTVLNRLSSNGFGDTPIGTTTVSTLAGTLRKFALDLAAQFDARNGTGYQTELALRRMSMPQLVERLPLGIGRSLTLRALLEMRDLDATEEFVASQPASPDLWRAKHLLWELYGEEHHWREQALAVLDELLAAEELPADLPSKASLAEAGAKRQWGEGAMRRYRAAADLYRADGDPQGELRALCGAIEHGSEEALALALGMGLESALLHFTIARLSYREGQYEEALARAKAAQNRDGAGWIACRSLIHLGRPGEVLDLTDDAVLRVQALRALGRDEEAQELIDKNGLEEWEVDDDDD